MPALDFSDCAENTAVTSTILPQVHRCSVRPVRHRFRVSVPSFSFLQGPQSSIPLIKALSIENSSQLSFPLMWSPKQQDGTKVLVHSEINGREPSTLSRSNTGEKKDVPNSRPSNVLEKDHFHSTLFSFYNNPRDVFTSPRSPLSVVGVSGHNVSGVSGSTNATRLQNLQHSPRIRHAPPRRLSSSPQSPSLPTVDPATFVSSKHPRYESASTGFWGALVENKYLNTQEFWLVLYFILNLSLTLYNKVVLVHFPYPYTVTALHALCGSIGGWSLLARGFFVQKRLSVSGSMALVVFSVLYAMNIAISNVSLNLVTVPVSFSDPQFPATTDYIGSMPSSTKWCGLPPLSLPLSCPPPCLEASSQPAKCSV